MKPLDRARQVFEIELEAIAAVRDQLDSSFDQAAELVANTINSRGKVVVVGIGKSGAIGRKIAATLSSTGSTSVVLNSVDALHGDLGMVNEGDVVLALSYSGESEELLNLIPALKRFPVKIIAMTGAADSTLGRQSDVLLNARVPREACPFNLAPTSSTSAMLILGDALAMAVLELRGFKKKDFADRHPSGAIGRAMLLRVHEIMRSGSRAAVAPGSMPVREALLLMTQARSGIVSVTDEAGRLTGVFTDGDLRRRMADEKSMSTLLDQPLKDVMSPSPTCIQDSALAVEALKIFDQGTIDDLIVVNENRQPVGIIDSQDLPRLKLM